MTEDREELRAAFQDYVDGKLSPGEASVVAPAGKEFLDNAEFVKHDNSKPRFSLLPTQTIWQIMEIAEYGAQKYSADNWKKCLDPKRYVDAAMRHMLAYLGGERDDPESKHHHLCHAAISLIFAHHIDEKLLTPPTK